MISSSPLLPHNSPIPSEPHTSNHSCCAVACNESMNLAQESFPLSYQPRYSGPRLKIQKHALICAPPWHPSSSQRSWNDFHMWSQGIWISTLSGNDASLISTNFFQLLLAAHTIGFHSRAPKFVTVQLVVDTKIVMMIGLAILNPGESKTNRPQA